MKIVLTILVTFILSSCGGGSNDTSDEVVVDIENKLMWRKCLEGQRYSKSECFGGGKYYRFKTAISHAKTVKYNSKYNWRVPTAKELSSIIYCSNGKSRKQLTDVCKHGRRKYEKPTINMAIFPKTVSDNVWSSTPAKDDSGWVVNFYDGTAYISKDKYYARLRLVRDMTAEDVN